MNKSDRSPVWACSHVIAQPHAGLWQKLMLLLLLLAAPAAWARVNIEKPLAADEGWLLVIADNQALATSLLLDGAGLLNDDLVDLKAGRNVRLLRAKAGSYHWGRVSRNSGYWNSYWNLKRHPAREFTVQAGAINYPGDFVLHSSEANLGMFFFSNRGLQAMMALDTNFPGLRGKLPWRTAMAMPDPFAEFAADKIAPDKTAALLAESEAAAKAIGSTKVTEDFGKIFNELYAPLRASLPALSPDGTLLVYKERRKQGEAVVAVDLASARSIDLLTTDAGITQLLWANDRAVYVGLEWGEGPALTLLRLQEGPLDAKKMTRVFLPGPIWVLNPLFADSRGLLVRRDSGGEVHVFAFDENQAKYDVRDFRAERRLDKGLDKAFNVFADSAGELRAALVAGEGGSIALTVRGADGKWAQRPPLPENIELKPVALSPDGTHLVVLSDYGREQVEMMKLDLASGTLGETIAVVPGADLAGAYQRTRDGAVIGVQYYRNGNLHTRYLANDDDARLAAVARHFPGHSVAIVDDSRDGRRLLLLVASETNPGTVYLYDRDSNKVENLFDTQDAFKHAKPAASVGFTVKSADGLALQGFLTLPAGAKGKVPLLVMAHGGPIGVADSQDFEPDVQMFASNGYAVLRVNYRGSGGSGRAFEQAGHGKWGREIEADIDLALEHALANFPLDRTRVALWGASYGGYSTLMNLISRPEKYRCGVAVAAVTDLPLMFTSSDWTRSDKAVASMKKIVGDPLSQMAQLREYSPAYQYQRLKRPLLLVHGTEDVRVSYEHTWRLYSLLAASGQAPTLLTLPDAGHSLSRRNDKLAMHAVSSNFLRDCLKEAGPAAGTTP